MLSSLLLLLVRKEEKKKFTLFYRLVHTRVYTRSKKFISATVCIEQAVSLNCAIYEEWQ